MSEKLNKSNEESNDAVVNIPVDSGEEDIAILPSNSANNSDIPVENTTDDFHQIIIIHDQSVEKCFDDNKEVVHSTTKETPEPELISDSILKTTAIPDCNPANENAELPRYSITEPSTPNLVMSEVLPNFEDEMDPKKQSKTVKTLACLCLPFYLIFYEFPILVYKGIKSGCVMLWGLLNEIFYYFMLSLWYSIFYTFWFIGQLFKYLIYIPCNCIYEYVLHPIWMGLQYLYVNLGFQYLFRKICSIGLYLLEKLFVCIWYIISRIFLIIQFIVSTIYRSILFIYNGILTMGSGVYRYILFPIWSGFKQLGIYILASNVFNTCAFVSRHYIILPIYNWVLMPIWTYILVPIYAGICYLIRGIKKFGMVMGRMMRNVGSSVSDFIKSIKSTFRRS